MDDYNPSHVDHHLYILRPKIKHFGINLDSILSSLFKTRSYSEMVECHFAFKQIIFFVFGTREFYIIDCVDVSEPTKIYFDIKRIKRDDFDAICFDRAHDLHHVCITECMNDRQQVHSKTSILTMIPKWIIQNNKQRTSLAVKVYCAHFSRKHKIHLPTVLIAEINCFCPIFK